MSNEKKLSNEKFLRGAGKPPKMMSPIIIRVIIQCSNRIRVNQTDSESFGESLDFWRKKIFFSEVGMVCQVA